MYHPRVRAATIYSYHRLRYTQAVAMPVREQISTCTISEVMLQRYAHTITFSTLKPLLCQRESRVQNRPVSREAPHIDNWSSLYLLCNLQFE
jgi:hypothetical protein